MAKESKLSWPRFFWLLPVYLTVGLMPIMVRLYVYESKLTRFSWYYPNVSDVCGDVFLAYRQKLFTGIFIYMLVALIIKFVKDKKTFRCSKDFIPLFIFATFSLLSAIFSKYPEYAFGGGFEQFESVFVLLGYALIVYYIYLVVDSEYEIKSILYVLTASTIVLGLIGTMQTLGYNILGEEWFINLITPADVGGKLSATTAANVACMTLYNQNYVGVYVTMLFPLYSVLLLFSKNRKEKIAYGITLLLLMVSLYGSRSKAAFLVLLVQLLILLIFLRKPILKKWYYVAPMVVLLMAVFLIINHMQDNEYVNRIVNALKIEKTLYDLQSIETKDDGVYITYKENTLVLKLENKDNLYTVSFFDDSGKEVSAEYLSTEGRYVIKDTRFDAFYVEFYQYANCICFDVYYDGICFRFTNEYDGTGSYYYMHNRGGFDKLIMAEQVVFNDYEKMLSGRGYIWSVTLPLLKEHIILGSGADTFITEFPQQDYLRLYRNEYAVHLVSKPHSLYLQVAIQDGFIAMLGMVVFFVIYLAWSVRLYIKSGFENYFEQTGIAIMLAVLGFVVMGLSNDSCIAVSPIFWAILGMGVWINDKVKKKENRLK